MPLSEIILARRNSLSPRPNARAQTCPLRIPPIGLTESHPFGGRRLKLNPFLNWTRDVLGYSPGLRQHDDTYWAMFQSESDKELFRLAFAEWFIG
jgi:hypothetical protein